jgi:hypothetical protein
VSDLANLKVDILDKTSYCTKRRMILLSDTAENLKNGIVSLHPYSQQSTDFLGQVSGISMLKYRDLHGKEISTEQGASQTLCSFLAAFMQIYGLERAQRGMHMRRS